MGETNRNAAAGVVVRWLEEGIPEPARGRRPVREVLNLDTILEAIRRTTLTLGDAERIVRALKDRELIETAVVKAGPGSEELIGFLERFWDYDKSPYVRAKLAHHHRIGRWRCYDCTLWVRHYWEPL
jgi:hypothetical protein